MMTNTRTSNLKAENAVHSFSITFRDVDHFYRVVDWLIMNVGQGKGNWTFGGRVLKSLKRGEVVTKKVYIFRKDFDITSASFLTLL